VPVVDPLLAPAPQPRHPLDELVRVVDFHHVRVLVDVHSMAHKTRRHRVGLAVDPDRAPLAHPHRVARVGRHPLRRQRPQVGALEGQLRLDLPVELGHHLLDEGGVGLHAREVAAASQHQGLGQRALQPVVALLHRPVLVRLPGADARRAQPVVRQHGREALIERASSALPELVGGRREIVRARHLGHAPECPEPVLESLDQGLVGLAVSELHVPPAAEAQHQLEEQVVEGFARDRHPERLRVREVELRLAPRHRLLLEVHLAVRPVERPPLAHPPLERPQLARHEAARVSLLQPLEQRRRLEHALGVAPQQRHQLALPHLLEGVRARPPVPRRGFRLRRQRPALPLACRPHAHPGRRGGRLLRLPFQALLPQQPDLTVAHHSRHPLGPGW